MGSKVVFSEVNLPACVGGLGTGNLTPESAAFAFEAVESAGEIEEVAQVAVL